MFCYKTYVFFYFFQYDLSVFKMSLVFLLMAGTYALASPLVGLLSDKMVGIEMYCSLSFLSCEAS